MTIADSKPHYEWDATQYSAQSQAQAAWGDEVIARLALQPADHVLDVGCGEGKITARIAERVPEGRVVGVDSSVEMIRFANERFGTNPGRLCFEVMDASQLTFRNEFDAVFSNAALHWVEDHAPVLRGIHSALREGGRVCMQMGGRGNAAEVRAAMDEVRGRTEWRACFAGFVSAYFFYGPEEYDQWLREAGLTPEGVELVPRPMRHTREQFTGWLSTTWMPYTSRVPAEDRPKFIEQVVDCFVRTFPLDAEGLLTVPMVRLNVDARKS